MIERVEFRRERPYGQIWMEVVIEVLSSVLILFTFEWLGRLLNGSFVVGVGLAIICMTLVFLNISLWSRRHNACSVYIFRMDDGEQLTIRVRGLLRARLLVFLLDVCRNVALRDKEGSNHPK